MFTKLTRTVNVNDLKSTYTVFTRLSAAAYKSFFSSFSAAYNIKGGLQSRAVYIFFFSLSKCLDDAQSFLSNVFLTKPSFRIIFPLFIRTYLRGLVNLLYGEMRLTLIFEQHFVRLAIE